MKNMGYYWQNSKLRSWLIQTREIRWSLIEFTVILLFPFLREDVLHLRHYNIKANYQLHEESKFLFLNNFQRDSFTREVFWDMSLFISTNNLPIAINITIDVRSGNFLKILGFYVLLYLTTEYYLLNNFPSWPIRACALLTLILQREEQSIYNHYELHCTRPFWRCIYLVVCLAQH